MRIRRRPEIRSCSVTDCPNSDHTLVTWELKKCEVHPGRIRMLCGCAKPYKFFTVKLPPNKSQDYGVESHSPGRATVICSLHYADGKPTIENPYPVEIKKGKKTSPTQEKKATNPKASPTAVRKATSQAKAKLRRKVFVTPTFVSRTRSGRKSFVSKVKVKPRRTRTRVTPDPVEPTETEEPKPETEDTNTTKKIIKPTENPVLTKSGKRAGLKTKPISAAAAASANEVKEEVTGPGIKTHCLICSNVEIQLLERRSILTSSVNLDDPRVTALTTALAKSVQEELQLDLSSTSMLMSASYCSNCYENLCDINFIRRSIETLEDRLVRTVSAVEKALLENFNLAEGVNRFSAKVVPVTITAYSHALRHIGSQVQQRYDDKAKTKNQDSAHENEPLPVLNRLQKVKLIKNNLTRKNTGYSVHLAKKSVPTSDSNEVEVSNISPTQVLKSKSRNVATKKTGGSIHLTPKSFSEKTTDQPRKRGRPKTRIRPPSPPIEIIDVETSPPSTPPKQPKVARLYEDLASTTPQTRQRFTMPLTPASSISSNPFVQAAEKLQILARGGSLTNDNLRLPSDRPKTTGIPASIIHREKILNRIGSASKSRPSSVSTTPSSTAQTQQSGRKKRKNPPVLRQCTDLEVIEIIDISDSESSSPPPKSTPPRVVKIPCAPTATVTAVSVTAPSLMSGSVKATTVTPTVTAVSVTPESVTHVTATSAVVKPGSVTITTVTPGGVKPATVTIGSVKPAPVTSAAVKPAPVTSAAVTPDTVTTVTVTPIPTSVTPWNSKVPPAVSTYDSAKIIVFPPPRTPTPSINAHSPPAVQIINVSKPAPAFRLSAIELRKYFGCAYCPNVFSTIEEKKTHETTHHLQHSPAITMRQVKRGAIIELEDSPPLKESKIE